MNMFSSNDPNTKTFWLVKSFRREISAWEIRKD